MKTLYIECKMGAAGDMLTAALLELTEDKEQTVKELNAMGIPHVHFEAEPSEKCGITGTHMRVTVDGEEELPHDHVHEHDHEHHHEHDHDHEHHHEHDHDHDHHHDHDHDHDHEHEHAHHHVHHSMEDITSLINSLQVSDSVKAAAIQVYGSIARAEAKVHNKPVTDIHFHEVGTFDAVADVVAVCYLMEKLGVKKITASPIHVGSGTVHCAHGVLPVPAPATAEILKDLPIYGGKIQGELCTPTGAALLRHFAGSFGDMPVMQTEKIGYGMGFKDFPVANCVRVFLGETASAEDTVLELNCNVDDMTGEDLGFALEAIYEAGAREAFFTPVQMKKNRPGSLLTVIVSEDKAEEVAKAIFTHTTTIGIRRKVCERYVLERSFDTVSTPYGPVRVKTSAGYGVTKHKAEFDDLSAIAKEKGISLAQVRAAAEDAMHQQQ
ncbi:MAG: nickel pincer cofactor biosynthesis protein LarC [Lachnospiraceae bacterium]|nr:nickel pincer cofactor biosynthesis protein LarC [Lachnospiraceae bacterium]